MTTESTEGQEEIEGWGEAEADRLRELIYHEGNVRNHRITWLITLNGLAFAAMGFAWKEAKETIPLIGYMGIIGSLLLAPSIIFADKAVNGLYELWEARKKKGYDVPIIGFRGSKAWGFVSWAFPGMFVVIWGMVLYRL